MDIWNYKATREKGITVKELITILLNAKMDDEVCILMVDENLQYLAKRVDLMPTARGKDYLYIEI